MRIHGQMYLGVEPPFVRPISWFPPRAPAASGSTLTWLASIISHSKSVSSTNASRIFSHIPLSRHRQNRRCTFFQFPYSGGKSRQGAPVRRIQNTPLMNCRVSRALPPRVPFSPIVYGLIFSQALSLISCRCCSLSIFFAPFLFGAYFITSLLTTPSNTSAGKSVSQPLIPVLVAFAKWQLTARQRQIEPLLRPLVLRLFQLCLLDLPEQLQIGEGALLPSFSSSSHWSPGRPSSSTSKGIFSSRSTSAR